MINIKIEPIGQDELLKTDVREFVFNRPHIVSSISRGNINGYEQWLIGFNDRGNKYNVRCNASQGRWLINFLLREQLLSINHIPEEWNIKTVIESEQ
jgi:hypothetical protein